MPGGGRENRGSLRAAAGGLTTRGRSFLAAGAAAGLCAWVLGQPDLLRVGLLLAALPLLCVLVLHRTRNRVSVARRLTPSRVAAGSESRVELRVENITRLPAGPLLLQDTLPYVLGPRPKFVLDRIEPGGRREVAYRVRSDMRGRYPLGPLRLRLADPFGMVELSRSFEAVDTLTVLPRTEPLPAVRPGGPSPGPGESRQHALAPAGDDDVIPRDYRHGDDLRRVHWRSTAHRGELMVRREEQPRRARCTVLLDNRHNAYTRSGPGSAFERAVSGAASVASHLLEQDYAVRLMAATGFLVPPLAGGSRAERAGPVLDALAVVDLTPGDGLEDARDALRGHDTGLLIAFVGTLNARQADLLAGLRRRAPRAVAFVAAGQLDPVLEERRIRRLRETGWTALALPPAGPLAPLWQQAMSGQPATGWPR
ncbi:DUF58 domain-containing protein [Streptomyces sodiiphilus]|uniref:DUF58 domain-containing protein n=1 Tax=Streptomyces sodiiphilus TaxID=226217 RepID=A0ABN2PGW8_9ACTN